MNKRLVLVALALLFLGGGIAVWKLGKDADGTRTADRQSDAGARGPASARKMPTAPAAGGPSPLEAATAAEDADPAGPLLLEGQVLGDDDLPIAGAEVRLSANPERTATTGADGTFEFDTLIGKDYWLSARKGNLVGGPVHRKLTGSSEPVIIRVHAGASLEVAVTAGDTPLSGAQVTIQGTRNQTTDASGVTTFEGVRAGGVFVRATADGYAPASRFANIADSPGVATHIDLSLTRGAAVSGRVVDGRGEPIAGATVVPQDVSRAVVFGGAAADMATTDEDGAFAFAAVAPGTYRLVATHKTHAPGSSAPLAVSAGAPENDVVIELGPGGSVAGRVVDSSRQPVPWASVRVMTRKTTMQGFGSAIRQATTDERGEFEMTGLPRHEVELLAVGESAASQAVTADLAAQPEQTGLELVLDVTGAIAGRVVDGDGEAIAEGSVIAYPDFWAGDFDADAFALRGAATATTDGDGQFRFTGLSEGAYRVMAGRARLQFGGMGAGGGTPAKTGDTDVTVVVEDLGGLKGVVRLDTGDAPTSYTVTVGMPPGVPVSSGDGAFDLDALPPGNYDVTFRGPQFAEHTRRDVRIEPGETADLGTITVAQGRHVRGIVIDTRGNPIAGATVVVGKQIISDGKRLSAELGGGTDEYFGLRRGKTGDDGRFHIAGIGKTELVIAAEHPDAGRSLPVSLPAGRESADIELPLRAFASLRGTITSNGEPLAAAQVVATPDESTQQNTMVTAGDDGRYQFERLAEGSYTVMAILPGGVGGGSFGKQRVQLTGSKPQVVDIDIEVGDITILASFTGKDGAHIDAAQVFWFEGTVSASSAREIQQQFLSSEGGAKAAFAFGAGKPAKLSGVVAGPSTMCMLPINGNMLDPTFQKRLQEHANELKVYCQPHEVAASPAEQTYTAAIPPMDPLPEPTQ